MIKILLVEDDLGLPNVVFDFLDDFGRCYAGLLMKKKVYTESGVYDLDSLLDLMLEKDFLIKYSKNCVKRGNHPVLIMTAKQHDDKRPWF